MKAAFPQPTSSVPAEDGGPGFVPRLRGLALRGLARMYRADEGLFVFRLRRSRNGIVGEGLSPRYTAIAVIGLAGERPEAASEVLLGRSLSDVCHALIERLGPTAGLGDLALALWACRAAQHSDRSPVAERVVHMGPAEGDHSTVELAWTLAALSLDEGARVGDLRERLAIRLVQSFNEKTGLFPHRAGGRGGLRSHVACFADLVYPVHALSLYFDLSGDRSALSVALRCADQICRLQGADGQWWWHYDLRTGRVIEGYPVYAVHQDAMAPMALLALQRASGHDFSPALRRGLRWLESCPELNGGSLVDEEVELIWRKVARREPGKLVRYVQAIAARVRPGLRVPGLDLAFPPCSVDHETRPYHLGWLLHALPGERALRW